jgi:hypothetical protein
MARTQRRRRRPADTAAAVPAVRVRLLEELRRRGPGYDPRYVAVDPDGVPLDPRVTVTMRAEHMAAVDDRHRQLLDDLEAGRTVLVPGRDVGYATGLVEVAPDGSVTPAAVDTVTPTEGDS